MAASGHDSLGARRELRVGDLSYDYFSLKRAAAQLGDASRLPYSLKVLFENLLRHENGRSVTVGTSRRWCSGCARGARSRRSRTGRRGS